MSAENLAGWCFRKKLSLLTGRAHSNSDGSNSRRRVKGPYQPMDEEQRDLGCLIGRSSSRRQVGEPYRPIKGGAACLGCQTGGPYCLQREQLAALGRWAPLPDGRGATWFGKPDQEGSHCFSDGSSSQRQTGEPYWSMTEWTGLNRLTGKVHIVLTGAARSVWWVDLTGRWTVEIILKCRPQELGGIWWEFNTHCIIRVSLVGRRMEKPMFPWLGGTCSIWRELNTHCVRRVSLVW